jgi:hypothetical protein
MTRRRLPVNRPKLAGVRPKPTLAYRSESGGNPLLICRSAMRGLKRQLPYLKKADSRPKPEVARTNEDDRKQTFNVWRRCEAA